MRSSASLATGDFVASQTSKNFRRQCAQHAASVMASVPGRRLALRLRPLPRRNGGTRCLGLGLVLRRARLQLLQLKLELGDLPRDPLRGAAELHPPQLGNLDLVLLDLQRRALHRQLRRLELRARRRQLRGGIRQCRLASERKDAQGFRIGRQVGGGERHEQA
jgi:hypothetical protein